MSNEKLFELAERHLSIGGDIRIIKSALYKVETVTAENWSDIVRLKQKRKVR